MTRTILLGLMLAIGALPVDPHCYLRCQREACRDACSDERVRERPEDCKACGEAYDRVCREQCQTRPLPDPSHIDR